MKAKKVFFQECHVAGRLYHDADEVWNELKVGTRLSLVRDSDNRYDCDAVAIVYTRPTERPEEAEDFLLGYLPREENEIIARLLEMGWDRLFECRICKINPEAHYEQQLRISIHIKRNEN